MEIFRKEYAKYGVYLVGHLYHTVDNIIISKVPIRGIEDIKGKKFRSSELIAHQLAHLGAGTDHPVSLYHPEGEYLKGFLLAAP